MKESSSIQSLPTCFQALSFPALRYTVAVTNVYSLTQVNQYCQNSGITRNSLELRICSCGCGGRSCGAIFGQHQPRSYCFQVQAMTCCERTFRFSSLIWGTIQVLFIGSGMTIMLVSGRLLGITSRGPSGDILWSSMRKGFLIDWGMFHRFFWNER